MRSNKLNSFLSIFGLAVIIISIYIIGLDNVKEKVGEMGYWAPLGIIALRSVSIIVPALPSTAYSILAGAILGFKNGLITIYIADIISCSVCFFISRYFGRNIVKNFVGSRVLNKLESSSKKYLENNFFLMTGVLMTGLFDFMSYTIGLTKTKYINFLPALVISVIISDTPIVALGSGLIQNANNILGVAIIATLILSFITAQFNKVNARLYSKDVNK